MTYKKKRVVTIGERLSLIQINRDNHSLVKELHELYIFKLTPELAMLLNIQQFLQNC